ncbi:MULTISPECIES: UDP-3-O-(3-hydroxymyristoyl)glucosamine N-acyltransferase [unclassified Acinetobacter]|uniref:UDP-3-O-(3-hydroxymyristoyl)glucosamine N-acyltransferase n=1 Tax=unclassified Acinetobacter TaxID=196816 RepID=UPI0008B2B2E7|nr:MULTISPECIES: UDP-3-O-(3-hydroxymyristoyl)glucosamine N-acyltransferase [unclassified Acinetobacter]SEL43362.1 UDP-3-O-[3-hydroxymyristoyl] glucosamine N-acyltransferase [Acinetobacter sp. DSM 11652]
MKSNQFRLDHLAKLVQGQVIGDADLLLEGLASLTQANSNQISFVNSDKYLDEAISSQAGALIVTSEMQAQLNQHNNFIVVQNPYLAFAILTHVFESKTVQRGIEATAVIDPSAMIGDNVYIGHYVVVGPHAVIGSNTVIHSQTKIDEYVEIGEDCFIDSHVTITGRSKIAKRVRIHANTVIGGEGFGFAPYQGKWNRIAQLGSVQIGNDVRIGSNCSIDRGALDDTILHDGVIIDNLVQVAHNVQIGENTAIAAKCGIAGSTVIGKNCILAGACGISGHLKIVDNVTLTGMSMVTGSILEAGTYSSGMGLLENSRWKRTVVRLRQLADVPLTKLVKQIDDMQAQLESIESTLKLRK